MTLIEIPTPARSAGHRRVPWHNIQVTAGCWLWTGPVHKRYGKSSGTTAHRHVWLALGRTIPAGFELDHLCRVPLCVNPDHLEPVTRAENNRRRVLALVKCINGHDYTPENTYTRPDGNRDCRICIRARVAKYRRALRSGPVAQVANLSGEQLDRFQNGLDALAEVGLVRPVVALEVVPGALEEGLHLVETVGDRVDLGAVVDVQADLRGRVHMHARTLSGTRS